MKNQNPTTARQDSALLQPGRHDDETGLPGLATWPRVYLLVAASFVLWVVLLWMLTRLFA